MNLYLCKYVCVKFLLCFIVNSYMITFFSFYEYNESFELCTCPLQIFMKFCKYKFLKDFSYEIKLWFHKNLQSEEGVKKTIENVIFNLYSSNISILYIAISLSSLSLKKKLIFLHQTFFKC